MLALLVAALAACAGGDEDEPEGARTSTPAQDRAWLKELGAWFEGESLRFTRYREAYQAALADSSAEARVKRTLDRLQGCAERFDREVGSPPGRRFSNGARLMRAACAANEKWAAAQREALGDPAMLAVASARALDAEVAFVAADQAVVAALAARGRLPRTTAETSASRADGTLSGVASRLAGRSVEIRCWSRSDWARVKGEWTAYRAVADVSGFADVDVETAHLEPRVCADLAEFVHGTKALPPPGARRLDLAWAIGVLAHEAEHISSSRRGEQAVECFAMQRLDLFARGLGASVAEARTLATLYASEIYPDAPREYRSESRCRDGGELDIDPSSPEWP